VRDVLNDAVRTACVAAMLVLAAVAAARPAEPAPGKKGRKVVLDGSKTTDPDNDRLTFEWKQVAGPPVKLLESSSAHPYFYATVPGVYTFHLVVFDGTARSRPRPVTVTVTRPNSPPVARVGSGAVAARVGETVHLDGRRSSDPDDDAITFKWKQVKGPALALDAKILKRSLLVFEPKKPGSYVFALIVSDGTAESTSASVTVTVKKPNSPPVPDPGEDIKVTLPPAAPPGGDNMPPVANAGVGSTITQGGWATLDGRKSCDKDGDKLTYLWFQGGGSRAARTTIRVTNNPAVAKVRLAKPGVYTFKLIVNDGVVDSLPSTVLIKVLMKNSVPVAKAGADRVVEVGAEVQLDGSGSFDTDGDKLTYVWRQTKGPRVLTWRFDDVDSSAKPAFTPEQTGRYTFALKVSDGKDESDLDEVVVTVLGKNTPPVVAAPREIAVMLGERVCIEATARDRENDPLTYRWKQLRGPALSLPEKALTRSTLEFTPKNAGGYAFEFRAKDRTLESRPVYAKVTVAPRNDKPVARITAPEKAIVGERTDVDGSNSVDPEGGRLTYQWSFSGGKAELSAATGRRVSFKPLEKGVFALQLTVTDGTFTSDPATSMIEAMTLNHRPVANAGDFQTVPLGSRVTLDGGRSVDRDGDALTYRWRLTAAPAGAAGAELAGRAPAFTPGAPGTYRLALVVSDGKLESKPDVVEIAVTRKAAAALPARQDAAGKAVPILAAMLSDTDATARLRAVKSLARYKSKPVAETLIRHLGERDARVREEMVAALKNFGAVAVKPLIKSLDDVDKRVREGALKALEFMAVTETYGFDARQWEVWFAKNRDKL